MNREELVDVAPGLTARRDLNMLELDELLDRQRASDRRMLFTHDAHEVILEQLLDAQIRRQLRVRRVVIDTDREIDRAIADQGAVLALRRCHVQRYAG